MSINARITTYVIAVMLAARAIVYAQEQAATSAPATSQADITAPAAPKQLRILEPESGVLFLLDQDWKQKYSREGTGFERIGNIPAKLTVRYPPDFKIPPTSAEALRDEDLKQAAMKPEWKKEHRKSIEANWDVPTLPDGISVISNSIEGTRNKTAFLFRNFYLTSPIKGVIAVSCELPTSAVSADDPCIAVVKSARLLSLEERERRKAAQAMVDRLSADSKNDDVPCSTVNDENNEYRSFYPNAKTADIPRFRILNTYMLAVYFDSFSKVKPDKLKAYLALLKDVPVQLTRLEDECRSNPAESYAEAVKAVFKTSKPATK